MSNVSVQSHSGDPLPGKQVARTLPAAEGEPGSMSYWLFAPVGYGQPSASAGWPLLIFLHGAGERGDDLALVKTHGPPRLVEDRPDFPFVLASPQCPPDLWWDDDGLQRQLLRLVDALVDELDIDPKRICLTGLSMGGYGVWKMATLAPERFAAMAPICGGGDIEQAHRLKSLPIWAFHGARDEVVPQEQTVAMVEAVQAAGGSPRMTIYPDLAHDSWTVTYDNPELYSWLLMSGRSV